jgi:hemolysin D
MKTIDHSDQELIDTSPEIADVIAGMPWWASRGLLYLIVAFVIAGLLWSALSKIDVVTSSRGTLVPEGYVKPIQSAGSGVVQNLFVREGDVVEAGQPLVQMDVAEMRTRLNKLREELRITEAQWRQYVVKKPVTDSLEQQNRIVRLQSDIAAAQLALQHTTIIAPVAGTVTTLEIRSKGVVLQAGQTIATISQRDARLLVEAQVANKDIAFIERGSPVKLKFDAFPFQDYGVVDGTVIEISPDAQTDKDSTSFYKVMIMPGQTAINAGGRNLSLRPGLALTAEIVTERKSILGLLLEPFRKMRSEMSAK